MNTDTARTEVAEVTVTLSNSAFYDHTDRLYDGTYPNHMDVPGARLEVLKMNKMTVTLRMTAPALDQFIDDMRYQVDWAYEGENASYKGQCERALAKLLAAEEVSS